MTATVEALLAELPPLLVTRQRAAELLAGEPSDVDDLVARGRLTEVFVGDSVRFVFVDVLDVAAGLA